ncbi:phosphoadenylyl-sulfate reductase [Roseospira goensis]|uniref:Adenosine 5'-phosphosulfate reductase n=1 Tax=Roseospira goensis TaxID=391922 RepID=A0A7W6WJS8_9PROT|nr:phosphoadenylyl-sulfate reductase [Roseospira goensis]MBB4284807.1 phosphoadenosine phosphosulfate reductase [Roseospira goensis]
MTTHPIVFPGRLPLTSARPGSVPEILRAAQGLSTRALLARAIRDWFPGEIAVVSSFGTESAVLLHLVAEVDPATPVLFLETGKLFGETLRYRDRLVERLGLRDVRSLRPDPAALAQADPDGELWARTPDACCHLRKVEPLERGLGGFAAWINGRKRHHGGDRSTLPMAETVDGRVKLNPLAGWSRADIDRHFAAHDLPRHPLQADGFASIGCWPCSDRVAAGEDPRAGRWRGRAKTECGIHGRPPAAVSAGGCG